MIAKECSVFLGLFLVAACGGEPFGEPIFGSGGEAGAAGVAGAGGQEGSDAGVGGSDAGVGGAAGQGADAGPCGPLMVQSGSVCVDKQPALHGDGSQGSAVSWTEAVTICEARSARLCTEAEREGACPDGQVSLNTPANGVYCGGPASTWEWSTSTSCTSGRCVSPCCNSVTNPCQCSSPVTSLSFRCCKGI